MVSLPLLRRFHGPLSRHAALCGMRLRRVLSSALVLGLLIAQPAASLPPVAPNVQQGTPGQMPPPSLPPEPPPPPEMEAEPLPAFVPQEDPVPWLDLRDSPWEGDIREQLAEAEPAEAADLLRAYAAAHGADLDEKPAMPERPDFRIRLKSRQFTPQAGVEPAVQAMAAAAAQGQAQADGVVQSAAGEIPLLLQFGEQRGDRICAGGLGAGQPANGPAG